MERREGINKNETCTKSERRGGIGNVDVYLAAKLREQHWWSQLWWGAERD
jgi:hypothetical protein